MRDVERIQKQLDARNYTARALFFYHKKILDTVSNSILLGNLIAMVLHVLLKIDFVLTQTTENSMLHSIDLNYLSNQFQLVCHQDLL